MKYFLMIARVLYDKGYAEYVKAAKIIRKRYPNVEFLLLGRIDEEYPNHVPAEQVEKDVRDGYIRYLGFVKDVRSVVLSVDCIVHPTFYYEGMSRVLMEAMALSKPIITTNIPGCMETVEEGVNGYLVKPRDVDSLVEAITSFLSLSDAEQKIMGENGRMKVEKEFDVKNVIAVYRQITG
ncbi:glycosyltransferase [Mediterranea massiliensis]|uniref:Glycosyltransferase n=1 Tax=Mediterranea massiliensis TaxID=1841865 RepID=A0ABS2E3N1_9BACT|nr:glycosyltransferase [Mediterranea massiliensis]MBM6736209.1 glycosyltransferase [Mediterranea massiliensis]